MNLAVAQRFVVLPIIVEAKSFVVVSSTVASYPLDHHHLHLVSSSIMSSQGHSGTASGGQLEEKADFSKETDEKLAQVVELVQNGALPEALAILGALEKRCRVGNDNASLDRVCAAAVTACHDAGDHAAVIQTINTYSTRRSQKMSAIKTLVQTPLPWCVQEPYTPIPVTNAIDQDVRNQLVTCLRDVTAGKLFLERERAQLTRALAKIKVKNSKAW
jgi:26S proteasome regulatory subunit N5